MIEVSSDLLAFLKEEEVRSRNEDLLDRAEVSLDSYNGQPYGDEEDGRSQVVTRDVAEVIDQMEIAVLRVFVSGDRVVEFEPNSTEEEQPADDATEVIHRQFARKGYQLLHDWFKEGNLTAFGVVKSCIERKRERVEDHYHAAMVPDHAIEAEETEEPHPLDGSPMVKAVTLEEGNAEFYDYLIPLEEFRVSPDARDLDDAAYLAHATPKTLSELVEMGFDKDEVDNLTSDMRADELSDARGEDFWWSRERKGALRKVLLLEEYVRFDADNDGIAERLCVHRVGNTVLRIEPTDYQPFVGYCPFPMPARLVGHALAEKVSDIQRINTVLNRLALDGLYCNLSSGYIVPDDAVNESTYDDLLTVRPNRIVRIKGMNGAAITPEPKNDVSGVAFQAMEFMIGQREARTGITRLNQGLDPDAINKTATGQALMSAQGQQMEEYLARNFAESLSRLMRLKRKLMSRFGGPMQIRVDGEFRQVDPRQWGDDMDVIIRVGLGSGRKEQRLANRMNLLGIQKETMMAGLDIVGPEQIYKSISGVVRDASLGSPADFVIDPSSDEYKQMQAQKPPQQDPEAMKARADIQLKQQAHEGDMQIKAADVQGKQQLGAVQLQIAQQKAESEAQLARDKAEFEREQAISQMMFEREMQTQQFEHEKQLAFYKADQDAETKKYRQGGDLSK